MPCGYVKSEGRANMNYLEIKKILEKNSIRKYYRKNKNMVKKDYYSVKQLAR